MFNTSMAGVLLPSIALEFNAESNELQWIATIYTLGFAISLLPGSAIGQRVGRKHTLLYGVTVFLFGSACAMFAPSIELLLTGRFLQAIGVGVFLPQTLTVLVHEYVDLKKRSKAVSIWAGVASIGLVAGPLLGGIAVGSMGWRSGFLLSVILGAVTLYLIKSRVSTQLHGESRPSYKFDWLGMLLSAQWLSCLVYGLNEASLEGWRSKPVVAAIATSVIGFAMFIFSQRSSTVRSSTRLMPLSIWHNRKFVAANLGGAVFFFTLFSVLFFYALYFAQVRRLTAFYVGVSFVPLTLAMGISAPIAGRLSARHGPYKVLAIGALFTAACCVVIASSGLASSFLIVELLLALLGVGFGLMSSTSSNGAVSSVPRNVTGVAAGVHTTCRQIGSTLGVALLGLIVYADRPGLDLEHGFVRGLDIAMYVAALLLAACAVVVYLLSWRQDE